MFPDIGGSELIIVAIVALLVVKPKDLPVMMRRMGEFMAKARRMANDFRASFEDMARQSELDDLRKEVEAMRAKASDPMGLASSLHETGQEIEASFAEPAAALNFNDGYVAPDASIAESEPAAKVRAKRAAKPKDAAISAKPRTPARSKIVKGGEGAANSAIVEGGPRKRAAAKTAKKAT